MNQHGQKILRYLKRDKRFSLVLIELSKLGQSFVSLDGLIICSTLWSKPMPVHRQQPEISVDLTVTREPQPCGVQVVEGVGLILLLLDTFVLQIQRTSLIKT
jgi:hypothetical protein